MGVNDNLPSDGGETGQKEMPGRRSSRRAFIKAGVGVVGGVALSGVYVSPTLRSIRLSSGLAQAYTNPPPSVTQGSITLGKTISEVYTTAASDGSLSGTMVGVITVTNVSGDNVDVIVDTVNDFIEYRYDGHWIRLLDSKMSIVFEPTLLHSTIPHTPGNNVRTYDYTCTFTGIRRGSSTVRNTIEVVLVQDHWVNPKVFVARDSHELSDKDTHWCHHEDD